MRLLASVSSGATKTSTYDADGERLTRTTTAYDHSYAYDTIGNLTSKAGVSYSYGSNGNGTGAGPHQARSVGGQAYRYDANGNLVSGGGRTYTWQADNLPASISSGGATETYTYDADGERLTRTANGVTTVYVGGLYEEDLQTGVTRSLYQFNGQIIAQRSSDASGLIYLHADHLGSVSLATNSSGVVVSRQDFDPWGSIRSGGIPQTALNYTGQRRDSTGLLYYHARYYDPGLGRFISADSVVPGAPDGSMDGVALKPLTVDFHETGFVEDVNGENQHRFWFQLSQRERQEVAPPWGPANPQGLNRYAYVQNNPLRYTDPTGHMAQVAGAAVGGFFVCGPACAIIAGGAVLIASAYVGAKIGEALAASQKDEPISGNVKRLPESEINPPTKRGNAPTSKKDGKPVELHHVNQDPNGPFEEMSRTDHRGKGNFKKNHSNTGKEKSRIDRDEWKAQQRRYWEKEYDRGRWNPK